MRREVVIADKTVLGFGKVCAISMSAASVPGTFMIPRSLVSWSANAGELRTIKQKTMKQWLAVFMVPRFKPSMRGTTKKRNLFEVHQR